MIMKILTTFLLMVFSLNAFSQDEIITKNDEKLTVRIVSEEKKEVSFYLVDDPGKSIQTLDKKTIDKIRYEKPAYTSNTIAITDNSRSDKDLFSHLVSFLIESGYELDVFDMEHSRVSALSGDGFRISAEIKDNQAFFSCYVREKEGSSSTTQETGHIIRFREPGDEEVKKEIYPGEKRMGAETKEFKALDEICRKYLLNNKGSLEYVTDPS
jgi:hypothetical protein